ncbi:MAG: spore coat associated protein CotJA [Eubacterium sp.]|nr:spore coat associated protein CotJA [Eubacterium sp.]
MSNEKCGHDEKMKFRPGYSYVPFQQLGRLYSPEAALKNGTIFPELNITIEEYERGLYNGR